MVTVTVAGFATWRQEARRLLALSIPPEGVAWLSSDQGALPFPDAAGSDRRDERRPTHIVVPREFESLARLAACHRSPGRWAALYRVLWRLSREGRRVLDQDTADDVHLVREMAGQVRRDEHKMRAFVRFVPVPDGNATRYLAWYDPDHLIVRRVASFFADRFASMTWTILTPNVSAHWDGGALSLTAGAPTGTVHDSTDIENLWRVYYQSIFNPARLNPRAMSREMPKKRWRRLPEGTLIPHLIETARAQTRSLREKTIEATARPFVPVSGDLTVLRDAAKACRGCRLHQAATQVVFGEGPQDARVVLVGEQPGDVEDRSGRPFVGPAGEVLDRALAAAGVERTRVYVTNAVKHFSFEPRGKRRIHQTPRLSEMYACRPWLEAELLAIRPATVVAMGSTAARALLGPQARVMALRGRVLEGLSWAPRVVVTLHPSAVLRREPDANRYLDMLVSDLKLAGA